MEEARELGVFAAGGGGAPGDACTMLQLFRSTGPDGLELVPGPVAARTAPAPVRQTACVSSTRAYLGYQQLDTCPVIATPLRMGGPCIALVLWRFDEAHRFRVCTPYVGFSPAPLCCCSVQSP